MLFLQFSLALPFASFLSFYLFVTPHPSLGFSHLCLGFYSPVARSVYSSVLGDFRRSSSEASVSYFFSVFMVFTYVSLFFCSHTYCLKLPDVGKSFAQALSDSNDPQLTQLPPKIMMGKSVRVKITQTEYEAGLTDCSSNLHGRLMLHKGDSPLTTLALKTKLNNMWSHIHNWDITPLGRGFFEFHFSSVEEMRMVWAMGAVNLKPGLLRFY